eukprot:18714-Heterococcus_DN1.PRE.2
MACSDTALLGAPADRLFGIGPYSMWLQYSVPRSDIVHLCELNAVCTEALDKVHMLNLAATCRSISTTAAAVVATAATLWSQAAATAAGQEPPLTPTRGHRLNTSFTSLTNLVRTNSSLNTVDTGNTVPATPISAAKRTVHVMAIVGVALLYAKHTCSLQYTHTVCVGTAASYG